MYQQPQSPAIDGLKRVAIVVFIAILVGAFFAANANKEPEDSTVYAVELSRPTRPVAISNPALTRPTQPAQQPLSQPTQPPANSTMINAVAPTQPAATPFIAGHLGTKNNAAVESAVTDTYTYGEAQPETFTPPQEPISNIPAEVVLEVPAKPTASRDYSIDFLLACLEASEAGRRNSPQCAAAKDQWTVLSGR